MYISSKSYGFCQWQCRTPLVISPGVVWVSLRHLLLSLFDFFSLSCRKKKNDENIVRTHCTSLRVMKMSLELNCYCSPVDVKRERVCVGEVKCVFFALRSLKWFIPSRTQMPAWFFGWVGVLHGNTSAVVVNWCILNNEATNTWYEYEFVVWGKNKCFCIDSLWLVVIQLSGFYGGIAGAFGGKKRTVAFTRWHIGNIDANAWHIN